MKYKKSNQAREKSEIIGSKVTEDYGNVKEKVQVQHVCFHRSCVNSMLLAFSSFQISAKPSVIQ